MWKFLKRQLKTKTGKGALTLLTGVVVNSVFGEEIGAKAAPIITDTAVSIVDQTFCPESIGLGLLAMFLRDGKAKEEQK